MRPRYPAPLRRRAASLALATILALGTAGCAATGETDTTKPAAQPTVVVLASTTSTQDSGLFDTLIPAFEEASPGYAVKVIAVGTGEALKLGEQKDADVLLVHAKADEERFVADGYGVERKDVMYNDFMIVGHESDPAGVESSADVTVAMQAIQAAGTAGKATWVSRGDDSGTHKKELKLWSQAGVTPTPTPDADAWYLETGQGMGETLKVASEKDAYTLADRATFLSMEDTLDLAIVLEKESALLNQYGVIVVSGAKNQDAGQVFADWIVGPDGHEVIGAFGVEKYGQPLFTPNAGGL